MSVDSPYAHLEWARQLSIPYPMLSDFNRQLLPAYDAINPEPGPLKELARRTAFVIDSDGRVVFAWYPSGEERFPPVGIVLQESQKVSQAASNR